VGALGDAQGFGEAGADLGDELLLVHARCGGADGTIARCAAAVAHALV